MRKVAGEFPTAAAVVGGARSSEVRDSHRTLAWVVSTDRRVRLMTRHESPTRWDGILGATLGGVAVPGASRGRWRCGRARGKATSHSSMTGHSQRQPRRPMMEAAARMCWPVRIRAARRPQHVGGSIHSQLRSQAGGIPVRPHHGRLSWGPQGSAAAAASGSGDDRARDRGTAAAGAGSWTDPHPSVLSGARKFFDPARARLLLRLPGKGSAQRK